MRGRQRRQAGRQRCRVAAVKLIKWQREKELQRQGRNRETEREREGEMRWEGERKGERGRQQVGARDS